MITFQTTQVINGKSQKNEATHWGIMDEPILPIIALT